MANDGGSGTVCIGMTGEEAPTTTSIEPSPSRSAAAAPRPRKLRCVPWTLKSWPPSAPEITRGNVVIKGAVLPSGNVSPLAVKDYFPSGGDGVNELVVPWAQTDTGPAEYAKILFPEATFGPGPANVKVEVGHYNACRLEAFDKDGNLITGQDHTAGQSTFQTIILSGGNIASINVMGAEIFFRKICYKD